MIAQVRRYQLAEGAVATEGKIDELMRQARSQLFRVHGVLVVRAGKEFPEAPSDPSETSSCSYFLLYLEFENLAKLHIFEDDPIYAKFYHTSLCPFVCEEEIHTYELDPDKDIKYS